MPTSVYGVPLHPLIVHATVVMIPLAALTVVLAALWPRFRSWAGPLPLGISAVGSLWCRCRRRPARPWNVMCRDQLLSRSTPSSPTVCSHG